MCWHSTATVYQGVKAALMMSTLQTDTQTQQVPGMHQSQPNTPNGVTVNVLYYYKRGGADHLQIPFVPHTCILVPWAPMGAGHTARSHELHPCREGQGMQPGLVALRWSTMRRLSPLQLPHTAQCKPRA